MRGKQESWGEEAGGCLRLIEAKEDLAALHNVLAKTRIVRTSEPVCNDWRRLLKLLEAVEAGILLKLLRK